MGVGFIGGEEEDQLNNNQISIFQAEEQPKEKIEENKEKEEAK